MNYKHFICLYHIDASGNIAKGRKGHLGQNEGIKGYNNHTWWSPGGRECPVSDKGYYILTRYSRCILTLKLSKKTPYNWLARPSGNKITSILFFQQAGECGASVAVNLHFQTVYAFCITIIIQKIILRMCIVIIYGVSNLSQSKNHLIMTYALIKTNKYQKFSNCAHNCGIKSSVWQQQRFRSDLFKKRYDRTF